MEPKPLSKEEIAEFREKCRDGRPVVLHFTGGASMRGILLRFLATIDALKEAAKGGGA